MRYLKAQLNRKLSKKVVDDHMLQELCGVGTMFSLGKTENRLTSWMFHSCREELFEQALGRDQEWWDSSSWDLVVAFSRTSGRTKGVNKIYNCSKVLSEIENKLGIKNHTIKFIGTCDCQELLYNRGKGFVYVWRFRLSSQWRRSGAMFFLLTKTIRDADYFKYSEVKKKLNSTKFYKHLKEYGIRKFFSYNELRDYRIRNSTDMMEGMSHYEYKYLDAKVEKLKKKHRRARR